MNAQIRRQLAATSNNPQNPNKNLCLLEIAHKMRVNEATRYLHTVSDLVRAARTKYKVRSRLSRLGKEPTVGGSRAKLAAIAEAEGIRGFIVRVDGHAMLLRADGSTWVDTDHRKADRRAITHLYAVWK